MAGEEEKERRAEREAGLAVMHRRMCRGRKPAMVIYECEGREGERRRVRVIKMAMVQVRS